MVKWLEGSFQSIELFYATVIRLNVSSTGIVSQDTENKETYYFNGIIPTFRLWNSMTMSCHGEFVNAICVHATSDLPRLWQFVSLEKDSVTLIVNKFKTSVDPLAPILHSQKLLLQSFLPVVSTESGQNDYFDLATKLNSLLRLYAKNQTTVLSKSWPL